MIKICPEHDLIEVHFNYCPSCGVKLWEITAEEYEKSWDFIDKKTGMADKKSRKKWIDWLKSRHEEFGSDMQHKKADELSDFLMRRLSREDYLKALELAQGMIDCLKQAVLGYLKKEDK